MRQTSDQCLNITHKIFELHQGTVHYSNKKLSSINQKELSHVEVHNYFCQQSKNRLIKITEVLFQDKVLEIKDQFQIKIGNENMKKEKQVEKAKLSIEEPPNLGRRNNYSDLYKNKKSDTKNLVKNIINLFRNWLHNCNEPKSAKMNQKLQREMRRNKYFNRSLIKKLCKDKQICMMFILFYQRDSQTAIENSRIKDKTCHFEAIKNYAKLFQESLDKDSEKGSSNSTNE